MPGTFAHLTLVDTLCVGRTLEQIGTLQDSMIHALLEYNNYCELGAVSPDYPYLSIRDVNSEGWANGMHYFHSAAFVKRAVRWLAKRDYRDPVTQKGIAWLFGFVAHVVADVSMHPVINRIVGPYEQNKKEHRRCEAHQDAYIFSRMNLGNINSDEYLSDCGLTSCSEGKRLDPDIAPLWRECLHAIPLGQSVKVGIHGPDAEPDLDKWHAKFLSAIDDVAEEIGHIPLICRVFDHVLGIGYPEPDVLDLQYIHNLPTPTGSPKSYDELFAWTQENTRLAWRNLGEVLQRQDESILSLADADLDTGKDDSGQSIYWKETVA